MSTPINQVSPKQGIFLGLLVAGAGALILLRAANVIQAGALHAPNWVVGLAGFVFLLPGLFMIYYGVQNARSRLPAVRPSGPAQFSVGGWLLGGTILTALGLVGAWVAFGPGAREFQGGITGSEVEGRIVFGIGAVITLLLAALVWIKGFQQLIAQWKGRRPGGPRRRY